MKWVDKFIARSVRRGLEYEKQHEETQYVNKARIEKMSIGAAQIDMPRAEGENRISFELSTAVGGKILNVRHYDHRKDRHESQTYVIPNGEDIGERVAKIINLEMFKQ
jgi:hypothetical protein